MKYIKKGTVPQFFIDDTAGLTLWKEFYSVKRRRLKKYILDNEQFGLCCYCEKTVSIDSDSSHVEHVKPKSDGISTLTFEYNNLLVSCQGNHFNEIGDSSKNTCGHKKNNDFDEYRFLNPTLVVDIADYFVFDSLTGVISASLKDNDRAEYTFQTLNLNGKNDKLAEARKKAKEALVKNFATLPVNVRKEKLKKILQNNGTEFLSFFRYIYRNLNVNN